MELNVNTGVHNRFDFVVIEKDKPLETFTVGDRGEYEVEGTEVITAHNVILNSMWTRLCNRQTFGGYIHVGKGTGSPSVNDTNLFSWVTAKQWTQDAQYRGFDTDGVTPLGYWRGYIQFSETEQNGVTISEVGVGYGAASGNIVTHALLQDSEGNPITFEKTNTKILRIYATIYATLNSAGNNTVWINPTTNNILAYLTGGTAPSISVYVTNARGNTALQKYCNSYINTPSTSVAKALAMVADVPNKRIIGQPAQFSTLEANINCINSIGINTVGFVNKNQYDNDSVNGVNYSGKSVGIGDGVNKRFDVPSFNSDADTVISPTHGALTVTSEILPTYMADNYSTNFAGIDNIYYSKYNMIKDTLGNFKSYLYKSPTVISRMYKDKQIDFTVPTISGFAALSSYAVCYSCDGFGTDDGYIIDFDNMKIRLGNFNNGSFTVDNTASAITLDDEFSEKILRCYVYQNKRFLLVSANYAGMYEQMSRNTFQKIWKLQTQLNSSVGNFNSHVYKDGRYWYDATTGLPGITSNGRVTYDSNNDRMLITSGNTAAYIAKYNVETGKYDFKQNDFPTSVSNGSTAVDTVNNRMLIVAGGNQGSRIAYIAKYNVEDDKYDFIRNDFPSEAYNGSVTFDYINNRMLVICGGTNGGNVAYIAKYNTETEKYEYVPNNLPANVYYGNTAVDSNNNRMLIIAGFYNVNAVAFIAKYNSETDRYDYTRNDLPGDVSYGNIVYDSINDRMFIASGYQGSAGGRKNNVAYVAKYNSQSDKYEYVSNESPLDQRTGTIVYDSINGRIFFTSLYAYIGYSDAGYTLKYNSVTGLYDYTLNKLPGTVPYGYMAYDNTHGRILIVAGLNSDAFIAKYNAETDKYAITNKVIISQNVNTGTYMNTLADAMAEIDNPQFFAVTRNQLAVNSGNNKYVIEFDPVTMAYVRHKSYVVADGMNFVSTPEFDAIIAAYSLQLFHHGVQTGYATIGSTTSGNVAYLSDCIIKAPCNMISAQTSIPDGVSYVEFDTAPALNEDVKLNWHCRGYDKQASLGQFVFSVGAYIQFGSN